MREALLALAIVFALGASTREARAEPDFVDDFAWGWTAFELSAAGTLVYAMHTDAELTPARHALYILTPIVVGVGAGFAAEELGGTARGGYAVHGAAWAGLDLAMIGALIRSQRIADRFDLPKFDRVALVLGGLGAAGGAYVGYTRIDNTDDAAMPWISAPLIGGFAGLMIAGVKELASPSAQSTRNLFIGTVTGLTLGLGAGWLAAELSDDSQEL
jgi:hypothetical protein